MAHSMMQAFPSPQSTSKYFHLFGVLGAKKPLNNSIARHIFKYFFCVCRVLQSEHFGGEKFLMFLKFFTAEPYRFPYNNHTG